MTLPGILALDPAQVRVMVAEKCGWRNINEHLVGDDPAFPNIRARSVIPPLRLDDIAQAVAGLTDEEQYQFGETLKNIVFAEAIKKEVELGLRDENDDTFTPNGFGWFAVANASALQRARAFLAGKSE